MTTRLRRFLIASCTLIILSGCVPSWNPLYTEKDLISDDRVVGTWKEDEETKETWVFKKGEGKAYQLAHTDSDGKTAKFAAHLLKLEGRTYLDLYVTDIEGQVNELAGWTLVPAHLFLRVDEIGDSLKMAAANADWLEKHLEKNPKAIAHQKTGDRTVIVAETKELQAFVTKHAEGEALFGEAFALKRQASK
jgi:hypothetical protein